MTTNLLGPSQFLPSSKKVLEPILLGLLTGLKVALDLRGKTGEFINNLRHGCFPQKENREGRATSA